MSTTTTAPTTKAPKPAPATGPLQSAISVLQTDAATLDKEIQSQQNRLRQIAGLENERADVRQKVDAETKDFGKGSSRLAAIAGELELHAFQLQKRSTSILQGIHQLRDDALRLKLSLLSHIDRAAAATVTSRQNEIAAVMGDWRGGGCNPNPCIVSAIAKACPTLARLESFRSTLEGWKPDLGLAALIAVAPPIAAEMDAMQIPASEPAVYGGHAERSKVMFFGYRDHQTHYELIDIHTGVGEAQSKFNALRGRSGLWGYSRVLKFAESSADNEIGFQPGEYAEGDHRQNSNFALAPDAMGDSPLFLERCSVWLAPGVA